MLSLLGSLTGALSKIGFIALAILILMLMITIHEFGHYITGKMLKFKINEFSVGFGKALFSRKTKSGEVVSLRLIPLGGYCAFDGEEDGKENPGSFNSQAPWKRLIVFFSGAFFNFLSAILFSVVLLAVVGSGITKVTEKDEYEGNKNLLVGDKILEINGVAPSFFNGGVGGLTNEIKAGENITLTVERDGVKQEVIIQKTSVMIEGEYVGLIGISSAYVNYSFGEALAKSVPFTFNMAWECLKILGQLVIGKYGLQDIGGPITTINTIADASAMSMMNLLLLIPLIAVNLAVFNLLPIPALDGAKMVFVIIEWIRRKPINRDLENKIHTYGLFALFAFVILVDLLHLFVY